jgi:hypothetical protein
MTTSKSIKLSLSSVVEFDVKFSVNDGGERREFGFRASAERVPQPRDSETIGSYMADRAKVRMLRWLGDVSPLKDVESGEDTPAGSEALAALFELLPNMPGLVYTELLQATQAKSVGR